MKEKKSITPTTVRLDNSVVDGLRKESIRRDRSVNHIVNEYCKKCLIEIGLIKNK